MHFAELVMLFSAPGVGNRRIALRFQRGNGDINNYIEYISKITRRNFPRQFSITQLV